MKYINNWLYKYTLHSVIQNDVVWLLEASLEMVREFKNNWYMRYKKVYKINQESINFEVFIKRSSK